MIKRKVLIVDDNNINRTILDNILSLEYDIIEAENGEKALEIMYREAKTLSGVLLDLSMPVMDGYEVLKRVMDNPMLAQIPIIIITGDTDYKTEINTLSLGAQDFVTKPFDPDIIIHRLRNVIKLRETAVEVNTLQRDKLTGLLTREFFFERAAELIGMHEAGYYVLACLDIDNFKVINDQYGSGKGDWVLKYIAHTYREALNPIGALCCRITADHFAVLYPSSFLNSELQKTVVMRASQLDGSIPPISISTGRYIVVDKQLSISAMFDRAMLAMSTIKGRYDVNIAIYDESMRQAVLAEQNIINDMQPALDKHQFEAWFQPQFNHSTGALIGSEALVRWRHPDRGLVSPGLFIPVFERTGFIYELDKYVWREVCIHLRKWLDADETTVVPVSVNISRYDLFRDDLVDVIRDLVAEYDIPVELLRLEITESAFSKSTAHIVGVVKQFIALGFVVEIDDFGSGYSSLNTLKDVPAQVLKLDMRFLETKTCEIDNSCDIASSRGGNILESIVRMSKWLDMDVIAEGVETAEQADYLASVGCENIQGYLYSKPIPCADYEKLLANATNKQKKLSRLKTVDRLDNNAFWDPASIDTLIFNSYVSGACVFEYKDGHIELIRVSEKYVTILGSTTMTAADILRLDWTKHIDEDDLHILRDLVQQSINTSDNIVADFVFYDLPGCPHITYLRSTMRVIAVSGERSLVYCASENITAQKNAEAKERTTNAQLQAVMANVYSGICVSNTEKEGTIEILYANNRFYSMLGYTQEQFNTELATHLDPILDEDVAYANATAHDVFFTGKNRTYEYRCRRRDGAIIYCRCSNSIMILPGTDSRVLLGVITDITNEKLAEQQMLEADEQFRFLNEAAHDALAQPEVEVCIDRVLRRILSHFAGDRAYVFEYNEREETICNTYEVCADGIACEIHNLQKVPRSAYDAWWMAFTNGQFINIADVSALPNNRREEREVLEAQGIRAIVAVPLTRDGRLVGMVGVDNPSKHQNHLDKLRALGDYLTVMITRRDLNARIDNDRRMLSDLMNDTPGGFARLLLRPNGELSTVFVNEPLCRMRNMTAEQIYAEDSESCLHTIHPDDMPTLRSALHQMRETGNTVNGKYRVLCSDGTYLMTNVFARTTIDNDGNSYINAYYADMSEEEKHTLSTLEALPYVLSAIMQHTTALTFAKDKNLNYICCSPAFAKMVGKQSADEVVGKTDSELFSPTYAVRYRADDMRLLTTCDAIIDFVEVIPSADGFTHYVQTSKYVLKDSTGEILGIFGTGQDITESRTTLERLKLVTDSSNGGLATYRAGPKGIELLYFNDAFSAANGYTRSEYEEICRTGITNVTHPDDIHIIYEQIERLRKKGIPVDCSYRVRQRDNSYRWVNLHADIVEQTDSSITANAVLYDITERKNAEETAMIQAEELKLAMAQMDKTICEYSPVTRVLNQSPLFVAKYGGQAVLKDMPNLEYLRTRISPDYLDTVAEMFNAIHRGDKTGSCEYLTRESEHGQFWRKVSFASIFNAEGAPVKTLLTVEDTTEQHTILEIERNRIKLGELGLVSHALFDVTTGKTIEYAYTGGRSVPEKYRSAFYYAEKNADSLLIDADAREDYIALNDRNNIIARMESGETEKTFDFRRHMENGETLWLRYTSRLVKDPSSNHILLFCYFYDIDEETTNELLLSNIVRDGYDFVARINGKNSHYTILLGGESSIHDIHDTSGDDFFAFIHESVTTYAHPADRAMILRNITLDNMRKKLATNDRFQFVCRVMLPDATIGYKKITIYYLDRARDILVLAREDVTQIIREEENKNNALSRALETANRASQAKTTFLSRMSHELRTPMNAILGLAELSKTECTDTKILTDNIEKISESAQHLLALINDILEMSRIESGQTSIDIVPFAFDSFLSGINAIISKRAEAKGVDYDVIVQHEAEHVYMGDSLKLRNILVNILDNAVKFTPSGGKVTLTAEELTYDSNHANLRFSIADTGIGIEEAFLSHLFDAFAQESVGYTATSTGTGLGLAIAKNLLDMMGGRIEVTSKKNQGSVFSVYVQLGLTGDSVKYVDMLSKILTHDVRVLVVDDDINVCKSSAKMLSEIGIHVEWTTSGAKAVDMIRVAHKSRKDYRLILLDWKMPDLDGIATARKIREFVGDTVAIALITAFDIRPVQLEARNAGVNLFLEKPLFLSSIVMALEKDYFAQQTLAQSAHSQIPKFEGKHILLAEDNLINVEVAQRLVERTGAKVTVTMDGADALAAFEQSKVGHFDGIIMDIRMPRMDGLTATKRIRALDREDAATIPIIAMTANAFDDDVQLSLTSGMNAHLAKPIEPAVLYNTLATYIH